MVWWVTVLQELCWRTSEAGGEVCKPGDGRWRENITVCTRYTTRQHSDLQHAHLQTRWVNDVISIIAEFWWFMIYLWLFIAHIYLFVFVQGWSVRGTACPHVSVRNSSCWVDVLCVLSSSSVASRAWCNADITLNASTPSWNHWTYTWVPYKHRPFTPIYTVFILERENTWIKTFFTKQHGPFLRISAENDKLKVSCVLLSALFLYITHSSYTNVCCCANIMQSLGLPVGNCQFTKKLEDVHLTESAIRCSGKASRGEKNKLHDHYN